jgi:hypothetical protein
MKNLPKYMLQCSTMMYSQICAIVSFAFRAPLIIQFDSPQLQLAYELGQNKILVFHLDL